MAIVINGSGTVTGISGGGLPDGVVDAGTLADNSVDSDHYVDGSIDNAHLADDAVDSDELAAGAIDAAHLASGVGGGLIKINSCTPSGASTCTFDSSDITSTYNSYLIVFDAVNLVSDGAEMRAQVSTDNGSSYVNSGMSRISWYQEDDDASISDGTSDEGGTSIEIAPLGIGNAAGESISGTVWMLGSQDTSSYTHMIIRTSSWGTLFQTTQNVMTAGVPITTVINNIKFYASSGNLADGTITLYGLT